jgi:DNA-directed RNA polymerase specialized sigma24 family protein
LDAGQRAQLQVAMTALAAGERSAFNTVFAALWPLLRRVCERALQDEDLARDAAQTALMKLFLHAPEFHADGDALTWAVGFASFECLSFRNRIVRRREDTGDTLLAAVPAGQPSPEDRLIRADLRGAALQLLGTLRPGDFETVDMALSERRTGAANSASRKRLQRALERLRRAWRETYGSDD